jgi:hypothetical protein
MKTATLTNVQKRDLRILFGQYKEADREWREEYKRDKEEEGWRKESLANLTSKMIEYGLDTHINALPEYIYSEKQLQFIEDCEQGYGSLHYNYSGRGMYGDYCPALYCDSHNDLQTTVKTTIDSMGLGIVIYVP